MKRGVRVYTALYSSHPPTSCTVFRISLTLCHLLRAQRNGRQHDTTRCNAAAQSSSSAAPPLLSWRPHFLPFLFVYQSRVSIPLPIPLPLLPLSLPLLLLLLPFHTVLERIHYSVPPAACMNSAPCERYRISSNQATGTSPSIEANFIGSTVCVGFVRLLTTTTPLLHDIKNISPHPASQVPVTLHTLHIAFIDSAQGDGAPANFTKYDART